MPSTISKKIIKPLCPTPSTQRWHNLSFLDQVVGNIYMPFVLFYPKHQEATIPKHQLSNFLTNSLSKTLTSYYSLAGSLKDNATIECDDHGVEFLEVGINSSMENVVHHPDLTFPQGLSWGYPSSSTSDALTVAQLSHFDWGGITLSLCMSHKVCAASSSTTNSGRSQLVQTSNLRSQASSQPTTMGNIITMISTPIYNNYIRDLRLSKLVTDIRKSKYDLSTRNNLQENELVTEMLDAYRTGALPLYQRNCDVYMITSTLAFEFEKLDFGFGKPAGVSQGSGPSCNTFILMNTPDDHGRGAEAFVNLNEQDMSVFKNDKDLLQFNSVK